MSDSESVPGENLHSLSLMTKQEFRDATRSLSNMTDEEFEAAWEDFQQAKKRRSMN